MSVRRLYFHGMANGALMAIVIDHLSNGNYLRAGLAFATAVGMFLWMISTTRPPQPLGRGQASTE